MIGKASRRRSSRRASASPRILLEAGGGRHRVQGRPLHRQRHRPLDRPVRGRARGASTRNDLPDDLRGPLAAACDETVTQRRLSLRLPRLRGRDRSRDRRGRDRALRRRRRRRPRGQSADPPRPDPRRHRAGRRPGAAGSTAVYDPRQRAAAVRLVHGLRHAARRHAAVVRRPRSARCPRPTNPLGIRAGGEGGTTPALAVVVNAIVDALSRVRRRRHIEMPATPERVWRAIRGLPPRSRTDLDATESGYGGSASPLAHAGSLSPLGRGLG